ncbi:MAG: hypothetical protein ACJ74Y_15560 [Bryobacteraceae bacterium]
MSTILLVEGDAIIRNDFCEALSSEGHRVLESQNTDEAVRTAAQYRGAIDLLIASDAGAPYADWHALTVQVKKLRPEVRVLIITGRESASMSARDALLEMPVTCGGLLQAVQSLLCV